MTDAQAVLLLPRLVARLSVEAPGLSIAVVPYGADIAQRMATGEVDLVFVLASTPLPTGAVSVALASDELAVVMSRKHPRAGGSWAISDYGKWPSVGVSLVGDGTSDLDTLLARDGVSRRFAAVTPSFVTALSIVGATDAVTTVSRALADRFAELFGLAVLDAPFRETELATTLVMARVRQGDRLLAWLAGVIADQPAPGINL
jgi:DNA-binding transcriptional LysR family regulator